MTPELRKVFYSQPLYKPSGEFNQDLLELKKVKFYQLLKIFFQNYN